MRRLLLATALALSALPTTACGPAASSGGGGESVGATGEALKTVCGGSASVQGIDVSHYQGSIDWAAEKAQGRMFGIASVGDGTYEDPTFATNWSGMKAAG